MYYGIMTEENIQAGTQVWRVVDEYYLSKSIYERKEEIDATDHHSAQDKLLQLLRSNLDLEPAITRVRTRHGQVIVDHHPSLNTDNMEDAKSYLKSTGECLRTLKELRWSGTYDLHIEDDGFIYDRRTQEYAYDPDRVTRIATRRANRQKKQRAKEKTKPRLDLGPYNNSFRDVQKYTHTWLRSIVRNSFSKKQKQFQDIGILSTIFSTYYSVENYTTLAKKSEVYSEELFAFWYPACHFMIDNHDIISYNSYMVDLGIRMLKTLKGKQHYKKLNKTKMSATKAMKALEKLCM